MVKAFVVCNCPHSNALVDEIRSPSTAGTSAGWDQRIRSWYMLFFQAPVIPELFFRKIDFGFIEDFHNTMAPERRPSGAVLECYKYTFGKTPGTWGSLVVISGKQTRRYMYMPNR